MKCVAATVLLLALLGLLGVTACARRARTACAAPKVVPTVAAAKPAPSAIPPWAKVAPEQIAEAKKRGVPVAFENDLGMRFVLIPAGTFLMGSPKDEAGRGDDERLHEVAITKPYYMQIIEMTNGQYRRWKPSHRNGDERRSLNGGRLPVVSVSWADATAFANWLSGQDRSRVYALPKEVQWEYACRAGTATRFSFGGTITAGQANCGLHASGSGWTSGHGRVIEVATLGRNAWGLYDMHGNVMEWCGDAPHDPLNKRVVRGGSWGVNVSWARSASRILTADPIYPGDGGFRLVSPLPDSSK